MARRAPSPIAAARTAAAQAEAATAAAELQRVGAPVGSSAAYYRQLLQTVEPWDRAHDETDLAWALFVTYRDMEPHARSYAEVARAHTREGRRGRDPKVIAKVADRHRWTERAREWDRHLDRAAQAEVIAARRAMAKRMAGVADLALELVHHELTRHLEAARAGEERASLRDLAKLVEQFVPVGLRAQDLPERQHMIVTPAMEQAGVVQTEDAEGKVVTSGGVTLGALMGDGTFREAVLHAQARLTALREGPPSAIDVPATVVHEVTEADEAEPADWPDDDDSDWPDDADEDPMISMDVEPV